MRTVPCPSALVLALLACGLAAPVRAFAQAAGPPTPSGAPPHHGRQERGTPDSSDAAKTTELKIPPEMWPRLDRGALFCASLDGLKARAEAITQDSGPHPLPPGCRPIIQATKVTVVDRVPPGAAQVRVDATHELGWTDAWLPDKAPATPGR